MEGKGQARGQALRGAHLQRLAFRRGISGQALARRLGLRGTLLLLRGRRLGCYQALLGRLRRATCGRQMGSTLSAC